MQTPRTAEIPRDPRVTRVDDRMVVVTTRVILVDRDRLPQLLAALDALNEQDWPAAG